MVPHGVLYYVSKRELLLSRQLPFPQQFDYIIPLRCILSTLTMDHRNIQLEQVSRPLHRQGVGPGSSYNDPYDLMNIPTTPKRQGEGINQLVIGTNQEWGLNLPLQATLESPSKVSRSTEGDQIYKHVKFLWFKDLERLNKALVEFDRHALSICSDWVFKPKGDPETLPSHTAGYSTMDAQHTRRQIDLGVTDRSKITTLLLQTLKAARAGESSDIGLLPSNLFDITLVKSILSITDFADSYLQHYFQ